MRQTISILLAVLVILALVLGGTATAANYNIIVTHDATCGSVTVTASGYGLSVDSAFQLVAGRASAAAIVTRDSNGFPSVTATFTTAAIGENGTAVIRTRYGGYLEAGAQYSPGSPYVAAELLSYRTC